MATYSHTGPQHHTPLARPEPPHLPAIHERTAAEIETARQLGNFSQQEVTLPSIHQHLAQRSDNQDGGLVWGRGTPGRPSQTPDSYSRPYPPPHHQDIPTSAPSLQQLSFPNTSPEPSTSGQECRQVTLKGE